MPEARIGLLVSAFALAASPAAIPVTAALRGLPRRPVLMVVLTGFALCDALTALGDVRGDHGRVGYGCGGAPVPSRAREGGHGRRTGCCTMSLTTRPESSGTSAP